MARFKSITIVLLALLIPASALCASLADDISSVESVYRSFTDIGADFTQETKIELIGKTVSKSGAVKLKKGGKFRIEYAGSDAKHYVSDGTTLWIYVPNDKGSLQTFAVNDKTVPKEALSFMSGFGSLKKEFRVTESKEFKDRKDGTVALRLVPVSKNAQYEHMDALFGTDRLLLELVVKNRSGNVSRYRFRNVKKDNGYQDSIFTPTF